MEKANRVERLQEKPRPRVWRLSVVVGYDPTTGNPGQLTRTVRGGARKAETELASFVTEAPRTLGVTVEPAA
ncbi:MAG: hypothetical protein ACRDYC_05330 [Acidimicrobiales bacterium]